MGFFEGLGRMVKGEPVFQAGDSSSNGGEGDKNSSSSGVKNIPVVIVEQVDHRDQSGQAESYWTVKNTGNKTVILDKIIAFGQTQPHERYLQPSEEFEIRVYRGPSLQNGSYTKAELQYRDESGDYFSSEHLIEYSAESDGTYEVVRVRFLSPVRDI